MMNMSSGLHYGSRGGRGGGTAVLASRARHLTKSKTASK